MDISSSLIEREVIVVEKVVPTNFKPVEVPVVVDYEIIHGRLIPTKFEKGIKYLPSEYNVIKNPVLIRA